MNLLKPEHLSLSKPDKLLSVSRYSLKRGLSPEMMEMSVKNNLSDVNFLQNRHIYCTEAYFHAVKQTVIS